MMTKNDALEQEGKKERGRLVLAYAVPVNSMSIDGRLVWRRA